MTAKCTKINKPGGCIDHRKGLCHFGQSLEGVNCPSIAKVERCRKMDCYYAHPRAFYNTAQDYALRCPITLAVVGNPIPTSVGLCPYVNQPGGCSLENRNPLLASFGVLEKCEYDHSDEGQICKYFWTKIPAGSGIPARTCTRNLCQSSPGRPT